jgi:ferrochelatase
MKRAVVLVAHGTVDALDELPDFLARIRRGHAAPPELLAELRRRYEAIGGRSPLNDINRSLAGRLEGALGVPVRVGNRLSRPYVKDVLAELAGEGIRRVACVPLAQYSALVYADAARAAAGDLGGGVEVACAESWALEPGVIAAYARSIEDALDGLDEADRARTTVVLTAHSLPLAAIRAGDPYEAEVRAAAEAVAREAEARVRPARHVLAFQSQGMSTGPGGKPLPWLGPDLPSVIEEAHARGDRHLVFAPIGFLADHVEILYDLDVEARAWVTDRGMTFRRTQSLNDSDALVQALARVASPLLSDA